MVGGVIVEIVALIIIPIITFVIFALYWGKQYNNIDNESNMKYLQILYDNHIHPLMSENELDHILEGNLEEEKRNVKQIFRSMVKILYSTVMYNIIGSIYIAFVIYRLFCFKNFRFNYPLSIVYVMALLFSILHWYLFFGKSLFEFCGLTKISKVGDIVWERLNRLVEDIKNRIFKIFPFLAVFAINFIILMLYLTFGKECIFNPYLSNIKNRCFLIIYSVINMALYQFIVIDIIAFIFDKVVLYIRKIKIFEIFFKNHSKETLRDMISKVSYLLFIISYVYAKFCNKGSFYVTLEAIGILFMLETVFGNGIKNTGGK